VRVSHSVQACAATRTLHYSTPALTDKLNPDPARSIKLQAWTIPSLRYTCGLFVNAGLYVLPCADWRYPT